MCSAKGTRPSKTAQGLERRNTSWSGHVGPDQLDSKVGCPNALQLSSKLGPKVSCCTYIMGIVWGSQVWELILESGFGPLGS
eukprot:570813-Amphidinium_carterae.1